MHLAYDMSRRREGNNVREKSLKETFVQCLVTQYLLLHTRGEADKKLEVYIHFLSRCFYSIIERFHKNKSIPKFHLYNDRPKRVRK